MSTPQHLSFHQARLLSAATGFLSLAWEIVWMRLFNYLSGSRAIAFGLMLGSYLLGLAIGALLSRYWQKDKPGAPPPRVRLARLFLWSNLFAALVLPLVSWLVVGVPWSWTLLLVSAGAMLLGTVLPMLCHLAVSPRDQVGPRVAQIYLANIIGSGLGSLLTGFVLLDWLPLRMLAALLLALAFGVAWSLQRPPARQAIAAGVALLAFYAGSYGLWERLQYRTDYRWGMAFAKVIESKHGVVAVDSSTTVYGNGVYDGSLQTHLHPDSWLVRPYFIGALHPQPRRVLVIGVSGGAWTQILAHHPDVEQVIGIEIGESYLDLIASSPTVSSLLKNSKVSLVIDDGRRWLRHHPEERFDLIVMNTTHHWREFASSLLSIEFLELAQRHLNPGGIVAWNTTESPRAMRTGLRVFPHSVLLMNFFVGSETPLNPDAARWRDLLSRWKLDGKSVFDLTTAEGRAEWEQVSAFVQREGPIDWENRWHWSKREHIEALAKDAQIITDDNLGHEFAEGNW